MPLRMKKSGSVRLGSMQSKRRARSVSCLRFSWQMMEERRFHLSGSRLQDPHLRRDFSRILLQKLAKRMGSYVVDIVPPSTGDHHLLEKGEGVQGAEGFVGPGSGEFDGDVAFLPVAGVPPEVEDGVEPCLLGPVEGGGGRGLCRFGGARGSGRPGRASPTSCRLSCPRP